MFNLFNVKINSGHITVIKLVALIAFAVFTILILTSALTVHAQLSSSFIGPIVECGVGKGPLDCGFCDLQILAQNIINFLIFLAIVVAILMFVYAGFLLVTAGANEGQISRGKSIFWTVFIGLFIILAAWLIIDTVMKTFYKGESSNPQKFGPWNELKCAVIVSTPPTSTAPPIVAVPPTIKATLTGKDTLTGTSFAFAVTIELGNPVILNWKGTPVADVQSCMVSGPLLSDNTKQGNTTINLTTAGTFLYTFSCKSISVSGLTNTDVATLNVIVKPTPVVTLTANGVANNITVTVGNPVTLTWDTILQSDFNACIGTGFSTSVFQLKQGTVTLTPSVGTFNYSVVCTLNNVAKFGSNKTADVTVIVKP